MKKILLLFAALILALFIVLLINTFSLSSQQISVDPIIPLTIEDQSLERLSQAIRISTISYEESIKNDTSAFNQLHEFLQNSYPLVHATLERETVTGYSLLYKWKGTDPGLFPKILLAHMDVVPIEEATKDKWKHEPFSGLIDEHYIWGRGALDNKSGVVGIMEAVELLLSEGFQPEADLYLAFGHDEETGGTGAIQMAALLKNRNITADFILDEGGIISDGIIPNLQELVALVGTAEKGYVSLELTVNWEGGHSSMPDQETSIEILSKAIINLRENQFPVSYTTPVRDLLQTIGPHMAFFQRMVLANLWLFKPAVTQNYERSASGNASIRTTTAPTIFQSGVKDNVLPVEAAAVVNFRILPGETSEDVIAHSRKIINDDRVSIRKTSFVNEPSAISPTDTPGFMAIKTSVKQIYGNIIVSPYLVIGATDSRHYKDVSENIYRFLPVGLTPDDLKLIHGVNERVSIENFKNSIRFYYQLVKNLNTTM
ncbi:M20 family peptidase [soil metagenome]